MNGLRSVSSIVSLAVLGACCASAVARDVRIEHVTVISPERSSPLNDATVLIRDDRIVLVASSATAAGASGTEVHVIDGRGLYLAPGLIDSHVHLDEVPGMTFAHREAHPHIARAALEQIPRSYLYFGYTTLVDLSGASYMKKQWSAYAAHPDVYHCGPAPVVDGYPMNWIPAGPQRYKPFPYMIVQGGEQSSLPAGLDAGAHTPEAVVSRMKADGLFCVKSFFERGFGGATNLPVPRPETMRSLVRAAHAAGMPVFLHANGSEGQAFAVETGVDVIAHGLYHWDGQVDAVTQPTADVRKILDGVVDARIGWQPTLQAAYGALDLFDPAYLSNPTLARVLPADLIEWYGSAEGQWFRETLTRELPKDAATGDAVARFNAARATYGGLIARGESAARYLAGRNARILFGTDTPAAPTYANPPGLNGWLEMRRLVAAGLTPRQVFVAATLSNATALGLSKEIGTVEAGKRANLILLRTDPMQSVQAYDEIVKVVVGGKVIERAELGAKRD